MARVSGFKPARPGRIHMRCPTCGRKQSNMLRHPEHDHPTAYMVEIECDNCGQGNKGDCPTYYTRNGREIDYWRWWEKRERAVERALKTSGGAS